MRDVGGHVMVFCGYGYEGAQELLDELVWVRGAQTAERRVYLHSRAAVPYDLVSMITHRCPSLSCVVGLSLYAAAALPGLSP
jgi:hypothetical protein